MSTWMILRALPTSGSGLSSIRSAESIIHLSAIYLRDELHPAVEDRQDLVGFPPAAGAPSCGSRRDRGCAATQLDPPARRPRLPTVRRGHGWLPRPFGPSVACTPP